MSTSLRDAWSRDKPTALAVDTETTGVAWFDTPFLASFAWDGWSGTVGLDSDEEREACRYVLTSTPSLILHNAKFDIQKLLGVGAWSERGLGLDTSTDNGVSEPGAADAGSLREQRIHDTEALAHLLDEHRPKGLKPLARSVLGLETDEADVIKKIRKKLKLTRADGLDKVYAAEPQIVIDYAIKDAEFTLALFNVLYPQVAKYPELLSLYELEQDLQQVLLAMETKGMKIDLPYTRETAKEYAGRLVKDEWAIEEATGMKVFKPEKPSQKTPEGMFNPNSPKQMNDYYHAKGITKDSFNKDVLKEIDDDLANAVLALRGDAKIANTYLLPILGEQRDGILHANFRQHGTRGRRMSSGAAEA